MRSRLPRAVLGLGLVSLLTDVSSEAIFPLLPAFLAALGASNAFIGLIEGLADLVANLLKYATGLVADRRARLKPLVLAGYGLSTLVRPLVALAGSPWHVLAVRIGDRVGKGVRTTPRDALIAHATPIEQRGLAYGFHRGMDHAGAALGTLMAAALLWWFGGSAGGAAADVDAMRRVFWWAAVPGALAMLALALTPEPRRELAAPGAAAARAPLSREFKRGLLPIALFACANATDAFVLVKAARLGAAPSLAPLLWLVLHVVKALTATSGGRLADRHGKRRLLAIGWTLYGVIWAALGWVASVPLLFVFSAVYGSAIGLVEGAEKAWVAELAGSSGKGRAFGVYNMMSGLAALVASTTFGAVWDRFGSELAFAGSGSLALLAAALLLPGLRAQPRGA